MGLGYTKIRNGALEVRSCITDKVFDKLDLRLTRAIKSLNKVPFPKEIYLPEYLQTAVSSNTLSRDGDAFPVC